MKTAIEAPDIPKAIGPYSAAISHGNILFTAGQLGVNPKTGQFSGESIQEQTRQALENMSVILKKSGFSFEDVVKVTVYLADIAEFSAMNEVYAEYFPTPFPARSAFQVAALPRNARVEIEAIAIQE